MAVGTPSVLGGAAPPAGVQFAPPRQPSYWIDNKTGVAYAWPLNHETEDALKTIGRRLTRTGNARRIRLMRQPTHPGPARLLLHGRFIDRSQAQYAEFISVFTNCDDRTFTYIDGASGDSYQVTVIQFDARRKQAAGREDGSYFEYQLEMEIITVNQGALRGFVA